MPKLVCTIIAMLVCAFSLVAQDSAIAIKLNVKNAQVADLYFGCKAGGSNDFNSKEDIMVPMMTMSDSGLVGFAIPKRPKEYLYKDMRSLELPQKWQLQCFIKNKPVEISWNKAALPQNAILTIGIAGQKTVPMSESSRLTISKSSIINIELNKKTLPLSNEAENIQMNMEKKK